MGLFVPFVDSLQHAGSLPSETSFGDVVVTPQLMLEEPKPCRFAFRYSNADWRDQDAQ
jgi:hypothetical protein